MSIRRLLGTALAMAAVAVALRALTPDLSWVPRYGLDLQRTADTRGAETLLLAAVAAVAWTVWAWGLLGLVLTALSAVPGAVGSLSRGLTRRLLPAGARRAAALALGVGLAAGAPLLTACGPGPAAAAPPAATQPAPTGVIADWPGHVADWPSASSPTGAAPVVATGPSEAVPDWPMPAPGTHVVLRGEWLWDVAAADLRQRTGHPPTGGEVAAAVHAWWRANAAVIGPDPDVLLPGQVLHPPAAP
jgi:hypothetical protein